MTTTKGNGFEFLSGKIVHYQELDHISTMAVNENIGLLALGLSNLNSIVLRHLDNFEEYFRDTESHEDTIFCFIFSEDGNYLFSGDNLGYVIQWNVKKKELIKKFKPHVHNVRNFIFYENNLMSFSYDSEIVFTDLDTLEVKQKQKKHNSCCKLFYETKQELMIGTDIGNVEVLDIKTMTRKNEIDPKSKKCSAICSLIYFSEKDSYFFGTQFGYIIEIKDGKAIKNVEIANHKISDLLFHQGRLIVVSFDEHLRILNPFNLEILNERKIEGCRLTWILNVKNQYFITGGVGNKEFHIWEMKNPLNVLNVLKRKKNLNIHFYFE
jgi:WD40 repeat protein